MNTVRFPDMIISNKTAIVNDKDATMQNLETLLLSNKYTLLGDPYFGSNIERLLYESNNIILQDIIIDDIFTAINNYMPQIRVLRNNITVTSNGNNVTVNIRAQNMLDYSFDEYSIRLLTVEEVMS